MGTAQKQRYYYTDFVTGKRHYTCAPFGGWTERTGPLACRYAWFVRLRENVYVPEYLLDPETKKLLETKILEAQQQGTTENEENNDF